MKKKIMIGLFIISIICVALYLILIPHDVSTIHQQTKISDEVITMYPLAKNEMILGAIGIFIIMNIPTAILWAVGFKKAQKIK